MSNYDITAFSISNNTVTTVGQVPSEVGEFTTVHTISSLTFSDDAFCPLVPFKPNTFTLVYKCNTTDASSTRIKELSVFFERTTYSIAQDGTTYFFRGKYLMDRVVNVNFEAESVQLEYVRNILEPFREKPFSATVYLFGFLFFHLGIYLIVKD